MDRLSGESLRIRFLLCRLVFPSDMCVRLTRVSRFVGIAAVAGPLAKVTTKRPSERIIVRPVTFFSFVFFPYRNDFRLEHEK